MMAGSDIESETLSRHLEQPPSFLLSILEDVLQIVVNSRFLNLDDLKRLHKTTSSLALLVRRNIVSLRGEASTLMMHMINENHYPQVKTLDMWVDAAGNDLEYRIPQTLHQALLDGETGHGLLHCLAPRLTSLTFEIRISNNDNNNNNKTKTKKKKKERQKERESQIILGDIDAERMKTNKRRRTSKGGGKEIEEKEEERMILVNSFLFLNGLKHLRCLKKLSITCGLDGTELCKDQKGHFSSFVRDSGYPPALRNLTIRSCFLSPLLGLRVPLQNKELKMLTWLVLEYSMKGNDIEGDNLLEFLRSVNNSSTPELCLWALGGCEDESERIELSEVFCRLLDYDPSSSERSQEEEGVIIQPPWQAPPRLRRASFVSGHDILPLAFQFMRSPSGRVRAWGVLLYLGFDLDMGQLSSVDQNLGIPELEALVDELHERQSLYRRINALSALEMHIRGGNVWYERQPLSLYPRIQFLSGSQLHRRDSIRQPLSLYPRIQPLSALQLHRRDSILFPADTNHLVSLLQDRVFKLVTVALQHSPKPEVGRALHECLVRLSFSCIVQDIVLDSLFHGELVDLCCVHINALAFKDGGWEDKSVCEYAHSFLTSQLQQSNNTPSLIRNPKLLSYVSLLGDERKQVTDDLDVLRLLLRTHDSCGTDGDSAYFAEFLKTVMFRESSLQELSQAGLLYPICGFFISKHPALVTALCSQDCHLPPYFAQLLLGKVKLGASSSSFGEQLTSTLKVTMTCIHTFFPEMSRQDAEYGKSLLYDSLLGVKRSSAEDTAAAAAAGGEPELVGSSAKRFWGLLCKDMKNVGKGALIEVVKEAFERGVLMLEAHEKLAIAEHLDVCKLIMESNSMWHSVQTALFGSVSGHLVHISKHILSNCSKPYDGNRKITGLHRYHLEEFIVALASVQGDGKNTPVTQEAIDAVNEVVDASGSVLLNRYSRIFSQLKLKRKFSSSTGRLIPQKWNLPRLGIFAKGLDSLVQLSPPFSQRWIVLSPPPQNGIMDGFQGTLSFLDLWVEALAATKSIHLHQPLTHACLLNADVLRALLLTRILPSGNINRLAKVVSWLSGAFRVGLEHGDEEGTLEVPSCSLARSEGPAISMLSPTSVLECLQREAEGGEFALEDEKIPLLIMHLYLHEPFATILRSAEMSKALVRMLVSYHRAHALSTTASPSSHGVNAISSNFFAKYLPDVLSGGGWPAVEELMRLLSVEELLCIRSVWRVVPIIAESHIGAQYLLPHVLTLATTSTETASILSQTLKVSPSFVEVCVEHHLQSLLTYMVLATASSKRMGLTGLDLVASVTAHLPDFPKRLGRLQGSDSSTTTEVESFIASLVADRRAARGEHRALIQEIATLFPSIASN